jgi:hypothetical protein
VAGEKTILVSLAIFSDRRLTPLEAAVKYLREERKLSYHKISELLARHVRDVYKLYSSAFDKTFGKPEAKRRTETLIPVSALADRRFSALESIVVYCVDELKLSYSQISELINRDQRTIWTVYSRARKKNAR